MNADTLTSTLALPVDVNTPDKRQHWWECLELQWQRAFSNAFFRHLNPPADHELVLLWTTPVLRFAGPRAPYPNVQVELTNCSGLVGMDQLETLVLTDHHIESIEELAGMQRLTALFVNNNRLKALTGVDALIALEQLHAQVNPLESLLPLSNLHKLREIYVGWTQLTTLDGISADHLPTLKRFVCLPNAGLTDQTIIRFEHEMAIRCQSA